MDILKTADTVLQKEEAMETPEEVTDNQKGEAATAVPKEEASGKAEDRLSAIQAEATVLHQRDAAMATPREEVTDPQKTVETTMDIPKDVAVMAIQKEEASDRTEDRLSATRKAGVSVHRDVHSAMLKEAKTKKEDSAMMTEDLQAGISARQADVHSQALSRQAGTISPEEDSALWDKSRIRIDSRKTTRRTSISC